MESTTQTTVKNLTSLVTRLETEKKQKRDMVLPSGKLSYENGQLIVGTVGAHNLTEICHAQIGDKLSIPAAYYKRMLKEHPELLQQNINAWLNRSKANYLVRTFDFHNDQPGLARAFLSDRFGMLDNYDVLLAALEAIKRMGVKVEITKAEVTDRRMYLHVTCPEVEVQADEFLRNYLKENDAAGNGIITGFVLTNSEIGLGTFEISPRAVICKCNNGLMVKDSSFRRVHLGSKMDAGEVQWSKRTMQKNYDLIISQTQDAIKTFLGKEHLGKMINKIAEAHKIVLENPYDTVQHVCTELDISDDHRKSILNFFLTDGDHKASGVFQAVTRQAQFMGADAQFEIEGGIGKLLPSIKKFDKPFSKN